MSALTAWFRAHPRVALAFSGGCDSAYLLHAALHTGIDVRAYLVQSQFLATWESKETSRMAEELDATLSVIHCDILAVPDVVANTNDRCYHCKRALFQHVCARARADGYACVIDGSNASDNPQERPGMRALEEMGVQSPLRQCGLTKEAIRLHAREAGLSTWNKPANACLATRIPCDTPISAKDLQRVERAEDCLRNMGFSDLRVRLFHNAARIQIPVAHMPLALDKRLHIQAALSADFEAVLLDMVTR